MRPERSLALILALSVSGCLAAPSIETSQAPDPMPLYDGWSLREPGRTASFANGTLSAIFDGDHMALLVDVEERTHFAPASISLVGTRDRNEGAVTTWGVLVYPVDQGNHFKYESHLIREFATIRAEAGPASMHETVLDPQFTVFGGERTGKTIFYEQALATLEPGRWVVFFYVPGIVDAEFTIDGFPAVKLLAKPDMGHGCETLTEDDMSSGYGASIGILDLPHVSFGQLTFHIERTAFFSHWTQADAGTYTFRIEGPEESWQVGEDAAGEWDLPDSHVFIRGSPGPYTITQEYIGIGEPAIYVYCDLAIPWPPDPLDRR